MSFWDRVRLALRREQRDLDEVVARANVAMDERERALQATSEERLGMEQAKAEEADAAYEELRRKIERND